MVRGLANQIETLSGPIKSGIWMSISAVMYVISIAIGRHLAPSIDVFQIAFLRNLFAMLFMLPWLMNAGLAAMQTKQVGLHIARGMMSSINVTLLFAAVALIPIAEMSAINFLQPIIGAAVAGIFLGELIGKHRWLVIFLGFLGALLIIRPGFSEFNLGIGYALGSALAGALVSILIKTLVRKDPPDTIAAWLFLTQTLILLVPTIFVWKPPSLPEWGFFTLIGLMSVILQRTYNRGIQAADISIAMPFNFTRLIWASLLGWIIFSEFPDVWTWIGGVVIFISSIWLAKLGQKTR
tara:strand:+ start:1519 stop:2403 length:885 start_codon:yes stop_codon:yes gene_type:complete